MENKVKEIIKKEIETLNLKQPINRWLEVIVTVIGILIGAIMIISLVIFYENSSIDDTWIILFILAVVFILFGIVSGIWLVNIRKRVTRENFQKVLKIWEKLHHLYFENTSIFFRRDYQLNFEGFIDSEDFIGTKALEFRLNKEKVVFSLSEDIEIITTKASHTFYFLKYNLKAKVSLIDGYDKILMYKRKTKKTPDDFFSSESTIFNKKYVVVSDNQLQVYKLFTPQVIDAYAEYEGFAGDTLELIDGIVRINFRSDFENLSDYCPEIDNLELINWEKTVVVDSLFNKIKSNFDFYIKIQKDLLPLLIRS